MTRLDRRRKPETEHFVSADSMLTAPVFKPWRRIWDAALGSMMLRLDALVIERQRGRASPPSVTPEVLRRVGTARVRSFIQSKSVQPEAEIHAVLQQLRPLIEAAVWPRWLLLEAALEQASASGALHLAALVLRTQIEELDTLHTVAALLALTPQSMGDDRLVTARIETLASRLLPRVRTKSGEELQEPAGQSGSAPRLSARLQEAFDALGDYVHPNYGSHLLAVQPHSVEAATILADAFLAVYESFFALPWACDVEERTPKVVTPDARPPFLVLAEETAPALARARGARLESPPWSDAVASFRQQAELEDSQNELATSVERGEILHENLNLEAGAVGKLIEGRVPTDAWPVPISTAAEKLRYVFLVENERRLVADAAHLSGTSGRRDDAAWLPLLCSALTFSINATEFKLDSLGRQAARLLNAQNVLGSALVIRSMLEHHAVAVELGKKLNMLWNRAERAAPNDGQVALALGDAEKQIARVLAGNPSTREQSTPWRKLWESSVRRYHVLDPVRAMDAAEPGYLKAYSLLSHIVHGTVCTGGDLLGAGGIAPAQRQLADFALFLAQLCTPESLLDRQAESMIVANRFAATGRDSAVSLGSRVAEMRLVDGQKLKRGRDVLGSGTDEDPFRFRRGLLYHEAYYHCLRQEGIQVRHQTLHQFANGFGDRVEAKDGRVLYFLNDAFTSS